MSKRETTDIRDDPKRRMQNERGGGIVPYDPQTHAMSSSTASLFQLKGLSLAHERRRFAAGF